MVRKIKPFMEQGTENLMINSTSRASTNSQIYAHAHTCTHTHVHTHTCAHTHAYTQTEYTRLPKRSNSYD